MDRLHEDVQKMVKEYYGDRYFDCYHKNPITGEEFDKLMKLLDDFAEFLLGEEDEDV